MLCYKLRMVYGECCTVADIKVKYKLDLLCVGAHTHLRNKDIIKTNYYLINQLTFKINNLLLVLLSLLQYQQDSDWLEVIRFSCDTDWRSNGKVSTSPCSISDNL